MNKTSNFNSKLKQLKVRTFTKNLLARIKSEKWNKFEYKIPKRLKKFPPLILKTQNKISAI